MMVAEMCRYCGCCSANADGSPGCIGTIPSGSHDGAQYLYRSRYMQLVNPLDPLIHSARWIERAKVVLLYADGTEGHSLDPSGAHYCACEWRDGKWVNPNDARLPRSGRYHCRASWTDDDGVRRLGYATGNTPEAARQAAWAVAKPRTTQKGGQE